MTIKLITRTNFYYDILLTLYVCRTTLKVSDENSIFMNIKLTDVNKFEQI